MLNDLRQRGVRMLYVDTADHRRYTAYARAIMSNLLERDDLPNQRKAEVSYATTRDLIREAFESTHLENVVDSHCKDWVDNIVTLICSDEVGIDGVLSMLSHDYYTCTHMVNVSVMVGAMAYHMGMRDESALRTIASGGLLHDIGKMRINPDTLNKQGALNAEEWVEVKGHPGLGLEFLAGRPGLVRSELKMVHQHHEKLDGSGYPLGLVRSEITTEAQMIAVIDVYDAVTCKRPYRDAMPHEKAVEILRREAGTKLNAEMVRVWSEISEQALANSET
ncbi:MAG: HD-GYP domain-containing protein [Phycisphaeraceae bacterium]